MAKQELDNLLQDAQSQIPAPPLDATAGAGIDYNKVTNPETLFASATNFFMWGFGIVAVVVIIYAGIRYSTAGGDSEKAETAKKMIIGAIVGLLIIGASYAIFSKTTDVLRGNASTTTSSSSAITPGAPLT